MTGTPRPGAGIPRLTEILAALTLAALALAAPGAWRALWERGEIYLFSWRFLADIPGRLSGAGRFRFVMQPIMAIALGIREGRADRSADEQASAGFRGVVNLVLVAILLDVVFQWVILGAAYPGAAVVVGPVLIAGPYGVARWFTHRAMLRHRARAN